MARITVVDDDEDFLDLMRDIVSMEGHDPVTLNGDALTPDAVVATRPDIVVVDVRPADPVALEDGWALADALRSDARLRHVHIVVSATDVPEETPAAAVADRPGIHALRKPFTLTDVEALLAKLLER